MPPSTLTAFGIASERIYVDHGLTGINRARPGLREAMAACRSGDVLVVTKLDRLARSLPDARDIVAEFESDLIKMRTREGMKVARATGRLRGKKPKLSPARNPTSSRCTTPARTPAPSSRSCSPSPAPPSTGRSSAHASPRRPRPDAASGATVGG
jgi:DNA invertase Pin-like site-specific DNA recombinase